MADNCIFCSIANKKVSANLIAETDHVLAFHDINPAADLHLLIIPKMHIVNINDLSEDSANIAAEMMLMAKDLAKKFDVNNSGYRLVMNNGKDAGQTVFHLHLHLMAKRKFSWPPG